MTAFVKDGELDMDGLTRAVQLATRIGLRQTNVDLDLPEWETVQKRDRLTGVSLSGIMDFESAMGWNVSTSDTVRLDDNEHWPTHSISGELAVLLDQLRYEANQEALLYAKHMRVPTPLLVTTV